MKRASDRPKPTRAQTPAAPARETRSRAASWIARGTIVLFAAGLLLAGWTIVVGPIAGWRVWGPKRPANLLLVSLDTLRADRLGSYHYTAAQTPNLDRLAASGLRFEQATTVVPLTLPAHASLMTGTFPGRNGVRDNGGFYLDDEHVTLAEVLHDNGFRTGGFVGSFVLDRRWGIAQGFDRYFDDFDLDRFANAAGMDMIQRPGADVVDRALEWLGAETKQPFFAWVHLYDAHTHTKRRSRSGPGSLEPGTAPTTLKLRALIRRWAA